VVSTAGIVCPEIVINGQAGYLVEVVVSIGWANSILHLIANPRQVKLMESRGRRLVEERYSLPMIGTQIEQAYINS
jgi:glycosyltransferase involved in cell wall biosynthesis